MSDKDPLGLFETQTTNDPLGLFAEKPKTSIGQDIGIGLKQFAHSTKDVLDLLAGAAAGTFGSEKESGAIYADMEARKKTHQEELDAVDQGLGGKIISGISQLPPALATGGVIGGLKGAMMIPSAINALSGAGENVQKGASLPAAIGQAALEGGIDYTTMALPAGKGLLKGAGWGAGGNIIGQGASDVAGQMTMSGTDATQRYEVTPEKYAIAAGTGALGGGIFGALGGSDPQVKVGEGRAPYNKLPVENNPSWEYKKDIQGRITTIDSSLEAIANHLARQTNPDSEYAQKLQSDARDLQNQKIQLQLALGQDEVSVGKTAQDGVASKQLQDTHVATVETRMSELESEYKTISKKGAALSGEDKSRLAEIDSEYNKLADYLEQNSAKFFGEEETTQNTSRTDVEGSRIDDQGAGNTNTSPDVFEPLPDRYSVNEAVVNRDYSSFSDGALERMLERKQRKIDEVHNSILDNGLGSPAGQRALAYKDLLQEEYTKIEKALQGRQKLANRSQTDFMALREQEIKSWELADDLRGAVSEGGLRGGLAYLADLRSNKEVSVVSRMYGELAKKLLDNENINATIKHDPDFEHSGGYDNTRGNIFLQDTGRPEVLLHEAAHSAVNKALLLYESGKLTDQRQSYAAKQIADLHAKLKNTPAMYDKLVRFLGKTNTELALENPRELVAYAFSDYGTQLALHQIKLGPTPVWSKLTKAFKDILGLNQNERTALDDVFRYGEQLIEGSDGKAVGQGTTSFMARRLDIPEIADAIRNGAKTVFAHGFTQNLPQLMRHDKHFTALEKKIREADIYREKVAREASFGKESFADHNDSSKIFYKLSATEKDDAVVPVMNTMSNKELATTMNTLVDGMRKGQDIQTTVAQQAGWSDKQKRLATAMQKSVDVLWESAIRMLGKNDLDPSLKQRMGYILMSRSGEHAVQISVNGVNIRLETYMTPSEAKKRAQWFKEQSGGKVDVRVGTREELLGANAHDNLVDFLETAKDLSGTELKDHINKTFDRLTIENSSIGSHSKTSGILAGFAGDQAGISLEKSGALWRDSIPRSINEYAQSIMNREVTKNLLEWHIDNDHKMSKNTSDIGDFYAKTQTGKPYGKDTVREKIRQASDGMKELISTGADKIFGTELRDKHAFDRFMGVFGNAFAIANITMKPAIWMAQPLQALLSVRSAFKNGEGPYQVTAAFMEAMRDISTGKIFWSKDFREAIYHVGQEGNTLHPQMMNEFNEIRFGHDPNSMANKVFRVMSGQTISAAGDKFSRFASFAFFYNLHKRSGLTGKELWNQAAKDTTDNMVGYGSKKMPAIYREMGLLGEQGSPLATFAHTQAGNLIVDAKEFVQGWSDSFRTRSLEPGFRNTAPLVLTGIIMMATGGAISLPLLAEYELLRLAGIQSGWWGGEWPDVKDVINKFAPTWVSHGILSDVTGMDVDASMRYTSLIKGIGSVQDYGLMTFAPHLGWAWEGAKATPDIIGGMLGTTPHGEMDQALKKVVPKGWPSGIIDYARHKDSAMTHGGAKGLGVVPRGDAEAMSPWFGTRSTNEAITMDAHLKAKQRDEEGKKLLSRAAQFATQSNPDQFKKAYTRLLTKHYNGDREKLNNAIKTQISGENIPMYIRDYIDDSGNMSEDNQRRFVRDNQGNLLQKLMKKD